MSVDEEVSFVLRQYIGEDEQDSDKTDIDNDFDSDHDLHQAGDNTEESFVKMDLSIVDLEEEKLITKYFSTDCCVKKCNTLIPRDRIVDSRMNCLELSKNKLDLVILSNIEAGIRYNAELQSVYSQIAKRKVEECRKGKEDTRHQIQFSFLGIPICRSLFLFLHACRIKRYKNLVTHYHKNGLIVREHGLANKSSTNTKSFTPAEIEKAVKFIEYTADLLALPLPGRLPKFKDYRVMKLPSSETKSSVYRKYIDSLQENEPKMSYRSFCRIWAKYIPYVTTMKPADDLCDTCRGK